MFELAGSPGMVLGCAAGDVLRVADDGHFEIVEHGENLCVQATGPGQLSPESFAELRQAVNQLGGMTEAPPSLRFVVVTVARAVGIPAIERVMDAWAAGVGEIDWWFGNGEHTDASD